MPGSQTSVTLSSFCVGAREPNSGPPMYTERFAYGAIVPVCFTWTAIPENMAFVAFTRRAMQGEFGNNDQILDFSKYVVCVLACVCFRIIEALAKKKTLGLT